MSEAALPKSRVMRISGANHKKIKELKRLFAKKHGMKKATYDALLSEALAVAEALLKGDEIYVVGDKAMTNLADARGEAIFQARKAHREPVLPDICVRLGKDTGHGLEP